MLALTQIGVCSIVILCASALAPVPTSLGASTPPRWRDRAGARVLQWLILAICTLCFVLPLLSVLVDGLTSGIAEPRRPPRLLVGPRHQPRHRRALGAADPVPRPDPGAGARRHRQWLDAHHPRHPRLRLSRRSRPWCCRSASSSSSAPLGIAPANAAPFVVILANSLLSLPFAIATLGPPLEAIARTRGKLIRSLGLSGWRQFALVEYPLLGRDIGVALALAFCFSLGDLGVIALFGTQDFQTLPLMMFRALGAYRSNDAAAIAALLLIGTIVAFIALPRLFERLAHAAR